MLSTFLAKQKKYSHKKKLIETIIVSLHIEDSGKELYLNALSVMSQEELDILYVKLTGFVEKIELKEISDIKKQSFTTIAGMRKKEAEEKTRDINAVSFLFHNI
ncbi:hypothetical protein LAT59_02070 [Candidatus Gracilibacteria bacterium]|nr:hypothetical protein [Candidatus Gracilibacteria bacterium]